MSKLLISSSPVMTFHLPEGLSLALTSELWWSSEFSFLFSHLTERKCVFCPESWVPFNTNCYYFANDTKTWADSRDNCTSMGGHLVIIESQEEQNFLLNKTRSKTVKSHWIGLTDQKAEGFGTRVLPYLQLQLTFPWSGCLLSPGYVQLPHRTKTRVPPMARAHMLGLNLPKPP
ncbi:CLC4E protein, partial [Polypterus senegalus]